MIDLITMPLDLWDMKYMILAKEKLSNFVESKALRTNSTKNICNFIFKIYTADMKVLKK